MRTPPCPFAAVETVTWPARAARLSRAFPTRFSRMRRRTRASVRAVVGGLAEMAEYVANRNQTVLDVVVHLAGEVAHRQAALGLAQARGTGAQPLGHGSEQAAERPDLVRPITVECDVQPVHVH